MKALNYHGPGRMSWEDKPRPKLQNPGDAIVKLTHTTICGTDLHILKGDVPTVTDGRTLGHEGVGTIIEKGDAVENFAIGDRVLISCITSCGRCAACRRQMYSHCEHGGWILGNRIDGTQAEYVRIPFADTSLYTAPPSVDCEALAMISDIFPTGFECGVLNGAIKPGDSVAIVGAGPIGLATLLTSKLYSPAQIILVDVDAARLAVAQELGATEIVNGHGSEAIDMVMRMTQRKGVDVAIEAVGVPESFDVCQQIVAAGGHIANIGVHGKAATLRLERLWDRNVTITTRLVDTSTTPTLLKALAAGSFNPKRLITHRFPLHDMLKAYDTFAHAARDKALKVILTAG